MQAPSASDTPPGREAPALSKEATTTGESATPARPEHPRRVALGLLGLLIGFLLLHVAMNRHAPYTSEAVVQTPVIAIAPNVSGDIVEVGVRDNQPVQAGDLLFRIDPAPYQAALRQMEAELANAIQQVGAAGTGLGAAEAALIQAQAQLTDIQQRHARIQDLWDRGFATRSDIDDSTTQLSQAQAQVKAARAQLEEARQRLGPEGMENPQIKAALAARERAQIDLMHTRVTAPEDGMITNTVLANGQFAAAGHRVATVVDVRDAWILAHLPENTLINVAPGDRVEIVLDALPGRIVTGRVESIAWGVAAKMAPSSADALPKPDSRDVWVRGAERIPVRIEFDQHDETLPIRSGALASVAVHTDGARLTRLVSQAWMRLVALTRHVW